jgi:hypothetical protein
MLVTISTRMKYRSLVRRNRALSNVQEVSREHGLEQQRGVTDIKSRDAGRALSQALPMTIMTCLQLPRNGSRPSNNYKETDKVMIRELLRYVSSDGALSCLPQSESSTPLRGTSGTDLASRSPNRA